jgi:hypothetical protein
LGLSIILAQTQHDSKDDLDIRTQSKDLSIVSQRDTSKCRCFIQISGATRALPSVFVVHHHLSSLLESVVKLLPCVIGVEHSSPEFGEPFRSETFGYVALGATARPPRRTLSWSRILEERCWLLVASTFVPLSQVRMFYADFRGMSLASVHGFERRNLVRFLGHLEYFNSIKIFEVNSRRAGACKPKFKPKPLEPLFL